MDPTALSRFIDRKPPLADSASVIEEAAKAAQPDAYLRGLHPQHPQFERLRQAYLALKAGRQLAQTEAAESAGVKKGATSDASIARRVLVNMEEWRWMPESLGDFYIWVNVPEFQIRVVRNAAVIHTERVVVGKTDTQTPIFSDEMEQIIFHPFWGIPDSIKQAGILPTLLRGSTKMMERRNLRTSRGDIDPLSVDWTQNDIRKFHVYQPPGDNNLLGVVKFRFPTSTTSTCTIRRRSFCSTQPCAPTAMAAARVRDPQKLAEVILARTRAGQRPRGDGGRTISRTIRSTETQDTHPHDLPPCGSRTTASQNLRGHLQSREQDCPQLRARRISFLATRARWWPVRLAHSRDPDRGSGA
jgi:hypothetical protein